MANGRQWPTLLDKLEALEAEVVHGLVRRLRLANLLRRFPARPVWAGFMFVTGLLTVGLLGGLAVLSRTPFVFPSLGPTAYLFFFKPLAPASSPRNALYGHAIGLACGYAALWLAGLANAPSALQEGVNGPRVLAAGLSLAATGALMILFRSDHPPAGATTLIVSLGLFADLFHLFIIEVTVGLLVLQAIAINRLAGLDYPLWAAPPSGLRPPRPGSLDGGPGPAGGGQTS
jgi:CBS-domain-containing membrane protein